MKTSRFQPGFGCGGLLLELTGETHPKATLNKFTHTLSYKMGAKKCDFFTQKKKSLTDCFRLGSTQILLPAGPVWAFGGAWWRQL